MEKIEKQYGNEEERSKFSGKEIDQITLFMSGLIGIGPPLKNPYLLTSNIRIGLINGIHYAFGEMGEGYDLHAFRAHSELLRQKMPKALGIGFDFKHRGSEAPLTIKEADLTMQFLRTMAGTNRYRIRLNWDGETDYPLAGVENYARKKAFDGLPDYRDYEVYAHGYEGYLPGELTPEDIAKNLQVFQRALCDPKTDAIRFRLIHK